MLKRKDVRAALKSKGFVLDSQVRDHDVYRLDQNPKEPVITKLSRGRNYRDLGDDLVKKIRAQLHLDTKKQLQRFVACPMKKDEYLKHLRTKKILPAIRP